MRFKTAFVLIVAIGLGNSLNSCQASDESNVELLRLLNFEAAFSQISKGDALLIVRFDTDWKKVNRDGKEITVPATRTVVRKDGVMAVQVQGRFKTMKTILGKAPDDQYFNKPEMVPFQQDRAGWNAVLLARSVPDTPKAMGPTFLVVHSRAKGSFLAGVLLGPLSATDEESIGNAEKLAAGEIRMPEQMIESSNPWLTYLGLAQLATEHRLSVPHFFVAAITLPQKYSENIARDLYSACVGNRRLRGSMNKCFLQLFEGLDAPKQEVFVKEFNNYHIRNPHLIGEMIDIRNLRKGMAEYRARIAHDRERAKTVVEIDKLLKIAGE